jgi:glutathione S-transferase
MTKQIYGQLLSRAGRTNWAAHECGIEFEQVDVAVGAPIAQKPARLIAVNPAGTIPTYVDGDFAMTESFAIGLYLARKYKPALMGDSLDEEGKVYQWTLFAATDLEKAALEMINNSGYDAQHPLDDEKLQAAREKLDKILAKLNSELEGRDHLVGSHFTLADLNVACLIAFPVVSSMDRSAHGNVERWLQRCVVRPAFAKSLPPEMVGMVQAQMNVTGGA